MLILASSSTARAELLRQAGFDPIITPVDLDEESYKARITNPKELVETLAEAKAAACPRHNHDVVLAADTIIFFQEKIVGKPTDRADAKKIITSLAGNTHTVWTGCCVNNQIFSDQAFVTFKPMTETEIDTYLDTNDWVGAAGAYRLKQSIHPFIEKVVGDESTVIGLPMNKIILLELQEPKLL